MDSKQTLATGEQAAELPSLRRYLLRWQTLLPLAIVVAGLAFALPKLLTSLSPQKIGATLATANVWLLLLGLATFYGSFVLRTVRWRVMLENVTRAEATPVRLPGLPRLLEILYLSWFANVLVPAKLGDIYRAYLLKRDTQLPLSRTYGTVLAERALDLMAVLVLFLAAAFLSVPQALPGQFGLALRVGAGIAGLLALGLVALRLLGSSMTRFLPRRVQGIYTQFVLGTAGVFTRVPWLLLLTLAIWVAEAGRFFFAAQSIGLLRGDLVHILGAAMVIALAEALLTTVPFTSGGVGFVESGMLALIVLLQPGDAASVTNSAAAAVLLDRLLGLGSILVFGALLFLLVSVRDSRRTRAAAQ